MKTLTDEQIDQCIDASITNYSTTAISLTDCMRAVALRVLALAAEPEQPDQTCEHCDFGDGRPATATPCCDCPNNRVSQFKRRPEPATGVGVHDVAGVYDDDIYRMNRWIESKPAKLDRTHQWFKDDTVSALLPGPVVLSKDGLHCITTSEGDISFSEQNIIDGALVRIPPPPPGVDLEGWDCRKPVRGDRYHPLNGDGTSRGYTSEAPGCCWDDPIFGMNRWIEPPQPAKRPWPVGPFKVFPHNDSDKLYYVQGQGYIVAVQCTKADAAAIAKSLDVVPRFADWAINRCMIAPQEGRAIVAELAGWDFSLCLAGRNQEAEEGGHT